MTMPITGKILEEIQVSFTITRMSFVLIGNLELLLLNTRRAVHYKQLAEEPMAGKKKSFILCYTRLLIALNQNVIKI